MRAPLLIALLLSTSIASAADQTRTVAPFNAISIQGPVDMVVEVGKPQSIQLKGDDKFLARLQTSVSNGTLMISYPKDEKNNGQKGNKILLSLPAMSAFHLEGAGAAQLNNIKGPSVNISFKGAGRLLANGNVEQLTLTAQGVGDVNTKDLLAKRANVNFEGIGAVKVHASERLDAVVEGMGSLNYYGHPKIVNKKVDGMGAVKAAD